jgi:tight adherence protein B
VARRLRLGACTQTALACLWPESRSDVHMLELVFAIHGDCGGDLAASIEMLATTVDQRIEERLVAEAAVAGAVLSSRLVAALPLLSVPLLPMTHAPLFDPLGLAMMACGFVLALTGLRWISRLTPAPPASDDPVAALADLVAGVLAGGIGLRPVLDHVARYVPEEVSDAFARASRQVALGSTWPEALAASSDQKVGALGKALLSTHRLGVPISASLHRFAAELRAQRALQFEAQTRKAPVMMVLPLVLCILPAFLLLALGPFVRGLSVA